ncbi:MAG: lipase family protein [Thiohalophilus sp.]
MLDMDIKLVTDPRTGIRLHQGYSQTAKQIYRQLKSRLNPDYAIRATGHSLGGAVALAVYLDLQYHQMSLYLSLLKAKIPAARRVPFENDFNLFNLFGNKPTQSTDNE